MEKKNNPTEKKKGKRKMIGWLIALGIIVIVAFGVGAMFCAPWSPLKKEHEEAKNVPIESMDFGTLRDGIFAGKYEGGMYKWRVNEVQVTIDSGKVTGIVPINEAEPGKKLPERDAIYERVLQAQSLDVDVVSGATLTSKAYLKGVEIALKQARK